MRCHCEQDPNAANCKPAKVSLSGAARADKAAVIDTHHKLRQKAGEKKQRWN